MLRVRAMRVAAGLCLLLTFLEVGPTGCVRQVTRKQWPPAEVASIDRRSPFLKAHARDGATFVFTQWTVDSIGATVSGQGRVLGINRELVREGALSVALDSVSMFETNVVSTHPSVVAMAVITGVSAAMTLYCIANPKACFGSCPTFYASDGERPLLQAEAFSASIAPSLEATDLDALYRARPRGRDLELRMRNEALETHVVRSLEVLVAPRAADRRVFADGAGEFWQAREPIPATAALAAEGDCAPALRAFDGTERSSLTDSTDLGAREIVDLAFPDAPPGDYGLVVAMRQTLLTTYLFYQTLAYLGREAGSWLAALERSDAATRIRTVRSVAGPGGIDVLVPDGTGWRLAGEVRETGPLASDVRLVRLPPSGQAPVRVRLRLTQGAWRLDWVGLARLEHRVEPIRLQPVRVLRGPTVDEDARRRLLDEARVLVTLPGDDFTLAFRLPDEPQRCELFLASRGYYLEWMRDEWIAEENPVRAARMFTDPAGALRVMAPEYKRAEAEMEARFWGSRYGRR